MTATATLPGSAVAGGRSSFRKIGAVTVIFFVTAVPVLVFLWRPHAPMPIAVDRRAALQAFAIWVLAFLPAWLFVRFLTARGPALWDEYVVHLHRLGVDRRAFLPEPPEDSEYHAMWLGDRRHAGRRNGARRNLYEEKFDAYYGRFLASTFEEAATTEHPRMPTETMFPVILTAGAFAAGWSAIFSSSVLARDGRLDGSEIMAFAFAGAYLFNLQTLIRRYFQTDLRASAYASAIARIISSVLVARVVYELPIVDVRNEGLGRALAFMVGLFPLAGLHALRRATAHVLGPAVQSLRSRYPLSDVQGMNLWYEARLVEEGIEDMQELVTANVVDVILHTRVPVSRLVDWLDQAHLLLYLEPKPQKKDASTKTLRRALGACGINRATTFLAAFGAYRPVDTLGAAAPGADAGPWQPDDSAKELAEVLAGKAGDQWTPELVLTLVRVLANNTALTPVLNWQIWGARRMYELQRGLVET